MFTFARIHHSPDSEGYYILLPLSTSDVEARLGPPHFRTSGERGQWTRDHHLVGILTLLHGKHHGHVRTWLSLAVKDGLTEEERQYLRDEVFMFAKVPDCTNAGHCGNVMQGWFLEESFYPRVEKPQDSD